MSHMAGVECRCSFASRLVSPLIGSLIFASSIVRLVQLVLPLLVYMTPWQ
jgi:hypothetical protein